MATALDIVVRAYKALTVVSVSSATSPTTEQRNDGLVAFQSLLDSWDTENLTLSRVRENILNLQVGVSSYTVGIGGTINVARPMQIIQAYIQDGGGNNYPLTIRTRDQWNMIGNRSAIITSQIPTDIFYDPVYPLGVLSVFPYPLTSYQIFFDSYEAISTVSTLTQTVAFPPGYERAFVFNLAVEIAAQTGIPLPQSGTNVAELASISKANIKRINEGNREIVSIYDGAILDRGYSTYNIYSDRGGGY